jgi:hypothetical protein
MSNDPNDRFTKNSTISVRLPEDGIQRMVESLQKGMFITTRPSIQIVDGGILMSIVNNVGVYPDIRPFNIDIFFEAEVEQKQTEEVHESLAEIKNVPESIQIGIQSELGF